MKYIYILLITLSLYSCAFHSGTMNSNANLGANNFEIIDLVSVQTSTKKYFRFGGLRKQALVLEAKKLLYSKYPLKRGQVFANISVDFQEKFILFINKTTVTLSADIVQFDEVGTGNQKFFDSVENETSKVVTSSGQLRMIKCGNEAFAIKESIYYQSEDEVVVGEVKAILNGLVLVYDANRTAVEISPSLVFHKIQEEKLKNIKLPISGVETIGSIVGKNSKKVVFKTEKGIVLLSEAESAKAIQENN